jgi:RHS repeat-associated protein
MVRFFDNLSVQYKQGPVLEENHYYPFGLTMAGISDQAIKTGYAQNKYRYNEGSELQNKEFRDGTGLEMYDAGFRRLDPQLGRFVQIDPLADAAHFFSTYAYGLNNPIIFNDPSGLLVPAPQTMQQEIYDMDRVQGGGGGEGGLDYQMNSPDEGAEAIFEANAELSTIGQGYDYGNGVLVGPVANSSPNGGSMSGYLSNVNSVLDSYGGGISSVTPSDAGPGGWRIYYNYTDPMSGEPVVGASLFNNGLPSFSTLSNDYGAYPPGFQQFIAIAVGESGQKFNALETEGIVSTMQNRINQASTSLWDPNWLKKISYGGNISRNFAATNGNNVDYNAVMGMTVNQISSSSNQYIQAAITAYNNPQTDYSNPSGFADTGLYFWNATRGLNASVYNAANYIITLQAGGTTFYRPK